MTKQKEEVSSRVKSLETDLSQHAVDEEKLQRLREERKSCQRELEAANQEAQSSLQELNSWEKIHVNLPRGLPVEKYHGQVFELIELKLDYLDFAKALQLSVGGKLEYVVVEDKDASKAIFKYNNFANSRRRVTLLPIRDCQVGRTCDTQSLVQNRRFVGLEPEDSSVMRCLDLVEYDGRRHEKLAQYVFGGSLVCANADIAQKITYQSNRRLAFPSVTVEGDVFQTGGVMSGGASKHHRQTLLLWKNFKRCSQLAGDLQERLKQIDFYLLPMEELGQKHARITRDLRLALNELQNLESAFAASTAGSERRRIGEMEERKEECARRLETLHTEKTSILEEIRKLEKEVYELHHHRDKLEGSLKKEVKELRQKVKSLEAKAATLQLETAQFRQELGVLEKEVLSVQQDIETRTKHLQDLENSIQDRITLVEEQKALVESVRKEIEKCLAEAAVSDKRHGDIASKLKKLQKQKEHYTLSLKKYQHSMDDREKNIQAARREMEVLQRGNEWLEVEALKFNQPGSPFDFRQLRPETARQRLQQLKAEVQKLQSSVNSSAATLLERTEKDLEELLERKQQVEHDKAKIEAVISELDVKKRQSLNNTWKQVNTNFTDIFENLLPNAQAKLDQVNSKNLMDGLEMKIAFNHKWKDSLAELSGGQRSLLALSLILALLKVKPAPVYILDEVDAALDLSHTQNIGSMIKTQFPTSQFIIVSLKEGMFSYADVLFRTRLIDGVSSVERHALAERPQNPRRGSYSGRGESRSSSSSPLTASRKRMKKQTQLQHSHVEETPYS